MNRKKKAGVAKVVESLKAPTPKRWRVVRNVAGTVAAVAGVLMLAPLSASVLTVVGIVGGVAAVIAGTRTITTEDAQQMTGRELRELELALQSKTFNRDLSDTEKATLETIRYERMRRSSETRKTSKSHV